jgi:hypothetical protein
MRTYSAADDFKDLLFLNPQAFPVRATDGARGWQLWSGAHFARPANAVLTCVLGGAVVA